MNEHTSMTFVGSTGSAILSLLKDLPLEQYVIVLIYIVYVIIFWYFFQILGIKSDIIQRSITALKLQLSTEKIKLKIFNPNILKHLVLLLNRYCCFDTSGLKIFNFICSANNCSLNAVIEHWIISDLIPNL